MLFYFLCAIIFLCGQTSRAAVTQSREARVVEIRHNNTDTQTIIFRPDITSDRISWVTMANAKAGHSEDYCTDVETASVCIAMFVGTVDMSGLVGCLGDYEACLSSNNHKLFGCVDHLKIQDSLQTRQSEIGAKIAEADDMHIVHYTARQDPSVTTCIAVDFRPITTDSVCPLFDIAPILQEHSDDPITTLSVTRSAFTTDPGIPTTFFVGTSKVATTTKSVTRLANMHPALKHWKTVHATTTLSHALVCHTSYDFYTEQMLFHAVIDAHMHAPAKYLILTYPTLSPEVPGIDVTVILSVYVENKPIDTLYLFSDTDMRALRVGNCMTDHRLQATFLTSTGNILHNSSIVFSPKQMCAVEGLALDCFCEKGCTSDGDTNKDGLVGMDDPDCAISSSADNGALNFEMNGIMGFTSLRYIPIVDQESDFDANVIATIELTDTTESISTHSCAAIDVFNGLLFRGNLNIETSQESTTLTCSLLLPSAVYTIYHAPLSRTYTDRGIVGPSGHVHTNVVVCGFGTPYISGNMDASGDAIAYLQVDTGISCPGTAVTMPQPSQVKWYTVDKQKSQLLIQEDKSRVLWFPAVGRYKAVLFWDTDDENVTQQMETAEYAVVHHEAYPPKLCRGIHPEITQTHIPRFEGDHEARAILHINYTDHDESNPSLRRVWSVQLTTDGKRSSWYEYDRTDANISPRPYPLQLNRAFDHEVQVMVLVEAPSATNIFVGSACYINAGTVPAIDQARVTIVNPVHIITCPKSLIVFTVASNIVLPRPTSGYIIDILDENKQSPLFKYTYAMGPFESGTDNPDMLLVQYNFGVSGKLILTDVRDNIVNGYAQYGSLTVNLDTIVVSDTHFVTATPTKTTEDNEYHCFNTPYEVSVQVDNRTPLDIEMQIQDVKVSKPSYFRGQLAHDNITRPSMTTFSPTKVSISLDLPRDSSSLSVCAPVETEVWVSPYIETDITVVFPSPTNRDLDEICNGRIPIQFSFPHFDSSVVRYIAVSDQDLSSNFIVPDETYYISVSREIPVILTVYHNFGTTLETWEKTSCSVYFPSAMFKNEWIPKSADITNIVKSEPPCVGLSGDQIGSAMVVVPRRASLVVEGIEGKMIYNGYPGMSFDGRYFFPRLPLGYYTATSVLTSVHPTTMKSFVCQSNASFTIGNEIPLETLIDLESSSTGTKQMKCPANMYGSSRAWREYYTLNLNPAFTSLNPIDTMEMRVWDTTDAIMQTGNLYSDSQGTKAVYQLPHPGKYVGALVTNRKVSSHQCLYFLPTYTISTPMYTPDDFVLEFIEYPSCTDTSDGTIRLRFPTSVSPDVHITVCEKWSMLGPSMPGKSCLGKIHLDFVEDHEGGYFIGRDVPFLAKLGVQIDIMGACRITREYTLAPSLLMYPHVSEIQVRASCSNMYVLEPVFKDPYLPDAVAQVIHNTGKTRFDWVINNKKQKEHNQIMTLEELKEGMTISVTIYNDKSDCRFTAERTITAEDIVPIVSVEIDPIVPHEGRHSLPVFCPGAADAFLYARLSPPAHDGTTVTWTDTQGAPVATVVTRLDATMAHSLPAGSYQIVYTYIHKNTGQECVVSDTVTIPEKTEYNILSHIDMQPAECNGGTASARLTTGDGCLLEPEFPRFFASMVSSSNRRYIEDNGEGSDSITGVPNGHMIDVRVQYPDKYKYRPSTYCTNDLRIVFAKAAPIPVFISTPDIHEFTGLVAVSMHVPKWYGDVAIEWQETDETGPLTVLPATDETVLLADPGTVRTFVAAVTDTISGCTQESSILIDTETTSLGLVAIPADQTMHADYYAADPVEIRMINSLSGTSTWVTTIVPSKFPLLHHIHNADDNSTTYTYALPAGSSVHAGTHVLTTTFVIHGAQPQPLNEEEEEPTGVCITPENTAFSVMEISNNLYRVTHHAYFGWALNNIHSGVHHVQIQDATCPVDEWMIFPPNSDADLQNPPVSIVQITEPSCLHSNDGVVIAMVDPGHSGFIEFKHDDIVTTTEIFVERDNERLVISGLANGNRYWFSTESTTSAYHVFTLPITLPDMKYPIMLIQPHGLPPPEPLSKSTAMAIRPRATTSIKIDIYVRYATAETKVSVWSDSLHATTSSHLANKAPEHECYLDPTGMESWPYLCTHTLKPGRHYTFATGCREIVSPAALSIPLAYQDPHTITCSVTRLPASLATADGGVSVFVQGGVGPFVYEWVPSYKTEVSPLRSAKRTDLPAGTMNVVVYDMNNYMLAGAGSRTCKLTLAPLSTFAIQNVEVSRTYGCNQKTRAVVTVRTSTGITPSVIGTWNTNMNDPPIESCSDPRMHTPTQTDKTPNVVTTVVPPGLWNVALCEQNTLAFAPLGTQLDVPRLPQTMTIEARNGEMCEEFTKDKRPHWVVKIKPTLYIEGATLPINVKIDGDDISFNVLNNDGILEVNLLPLGILPPGMFTAEVSDARECPVSVSFTNKDTGPAACGTCDISDTTCFGCDDIAFSGARMDACGVCNGKNTCLDDCTISVNSDDIKMNEAEIIECNSRGKLVFVPSGAHCVVKDGTLDMMLQGLSTATDEYPKLGEMNVRVSTLVLEKVSITTDIYVTTNSLLIKDSMIQGKIHLIGADCTRVPVITIEDSHVYTGSHIIAMSCMQPVFTSQLARTGRYSRRREEEEQEDNDPVQTTMNGTEVVIFGSDVDGLSVTGNNVNMTTDNSSVTEIVLVFGSSMKIVQSNSTITTIDITEYRIAGASAIETSCILFRDIPTLKTVKNKKQTYNRGTYDCSRYDYNNIGEDVNSKTWVAMTAGILLVFTASSVYAIGLSIKKTKQNTPFAT